MRAARILLFLWAWLGLGLAPAWAGPQLILLFTGNGAGEAKPCPT
jgi:hypothetical protein